MTNRKDEYKKKIIFSNNLHDTWTLFGRFCPIVTKNVKLVIILQLSRRKNSNEPVNRIGCAVVRVVQIRS